MIWCRCAVIILMFTFTWLPEWSSKKTLINLRHLGRGKRKEIIRLDWISSGGGSTLTFTARLNIPSVKLDAIVVLSALSDSPEPSGRKKKRKRIVKFSIWCFYDFEETYTTREKFQICFSFIARLGPNLSTRYIVQVMIALLKQKAERRKRKEHKGENVIGAGWGLHLIRWSVEHRGKLGEEEGEAELEWKGKCFERLCGKYF